MSFAIAQKTSQAKERVTASVGAHGALKSPQSRHANFPVPVIQHKSSCACGGGCPRCEGGSAIQTKLRIGQPGDKYEQEVDRLAGEEELLQARFTDSEKPAQFQGDVSKAEHPNGLPLPLKAGLESLSGMDLSAVRVHNNSSKPAQLNALAYTQGQDIHVATGQEKHLPHEGWHTVQQMQGRVKPTMQAKGVTINDDAGLEREADVMGAKALQMKGVEQATMGSAQHLSSSLQLQKSDPPEKKNSQFDLDVKVIEHDYHWLAKEQQKGVSRLKREAEEQDPPSLLDSVIVAALEIALAGAISSLGKFIEQGLKKVKKTAGMAWTESAIIVKGVSDASKEFVKKTTKSVVGTLIDKGANSIKAFWQGQEDTLDKTARIQQQKFIDQEDELRKAPDAAEQAAALRRELNHAIENAIETQQKHSLEQWLTYLAITSLGGGYKPYLETGFNYLLKAEGVLTLILKVGDPGETPKIRSARINGVNKKILHRIENRPLKDLQIPMIVHVYLWGDLTSFGLHPDGEVRWRRISKKAGEWINKRWEMAGFAETPQRYGLDGLRLLIQEDAKDLTIKGAREIRISRRSRIRNL